MKDYMRELKILKDESELREEVTVLTYTQEYIHLVFDDIHKILSNRKTKAKMDRLINKCFKIFGDKDGDYIIPVLTSATVHMMSKIELESRIKEKELIKGFPRIINDVDDGDDIEYVKDKPADLEFYH